MSGIQERLARLREQQKKDALEKSAGASGTDKGWATKSILQLAQNRQLGNVARAKMMWGNNNNDNNNNNTGNNKPQPSPSPSPKPIIITKEKPQNVEVPVIRKYVVTHVVNRPRSDLDDDDDRSKKFTSLLQSSYMTEQDFSKAAGFAVEPEIDSPKIQVTGSPAQPDPETLPTNDFTRLIQHNLPKSIRLDVSTNIFISSKLEEGTSPAMLMSVIDDIYQDEISVLTGLVKDQFRKKRISKFSTMPFDNLKRIVRRILNFRVNKKLVFDRDQFLQLKELNCDKLAELIIKLGISNVEDLNNYGPTKFKLCFMQIFMNNQEDKGDDNGPGLDKSFMGDAFKFKPTLVVTPQPVVTKQPDLQPTKPGVPASIDEIKRVWKVFFDSNDFGSILKNWKIVKRSIGMEHVYGMKVYEKVKEFLFGNLFSTRELFQMMDKRRSQSEYTTSFWNNNSMPIKIAVVGAGPGGLRTAIEAALLGYDVTLVEMRSRFARNNLVHIWDPTIRDLKNIGAKYFFPGLGSGDVHHVPIKKVQEFLVKICLVLGVRIHGAAKFTNWKWESSGSIQIDLMCYDNDVDPDIKQAEEEIPKCLSGIHAIVMANGTNSEFGKKFGFEWKETKGSTAIGITGNFKNLGTADEKKINQFGLLRCYEQKFFDELTKEYGISLENLVYYRSKWNHYTVMTAKLENLFDKKVLKSNCGGTKDISILLKPENVDLLQLEKYIREVMNYIELPAKCDWISDHNGRKDMAIFDFSSKKAALVQAQILKDGSNPNKRALALLVGDVLVEPFWPQGTGVNRAILAAMDAAWALKGMFKNGRLDRSLLEKPLDDSVLLERWNTTYNRLLRNVEERDLVGNQGLHTIDPATRYTKKMFGLKRFN